MTNATTTETETLTVTVPLQVPVGRIKDLLTSAFEGGSNYWVEVAERLGEAKDRKQAEFLSDAPFVKNGCLRIKDNLDMDGEKWFLLTPQILVEGLKVMAHKYPKAWTDFLNENDDAETADIFLQCVCFGDVIYG